MFSDMFKQYKAMLPDFPSSRRPRVGFVIREIRTNRGIRQMDLAKQADINQSTFKSLENDHQKATTVDNLSSCAKELNVSAEELILLGREYDPANLFAMKRSDEIPHIEGLRQKKHTPEDWFQSVRIRFKDFDITPISAPINMKRDFFVCRVVIPPKRSITNLQLGAHIPVIGYVIDGFNLKIRYTGSEHSVTSGQAYAVDGFIKHSICNDNEDHAAILYWVTKVPNKSLQSGTPRLMSDKKNTINISKGVDVLRRRISDRTHRSMSLKHLSDLTDTLNERQINEMTRLKQGSSVVYWEKIEDLLSAGDVTMEDFLSWSKGLEPSPFTIATARTRAWIEYPNSGLKIYSCTPPCIDNKFFTGEIFLEGLNQIKKDGWERRDKAMLAFYVEEGDVQIFAGKRKKTFNLSKGESIYLDGNLGYTLRNVSKTQARLFLATFKSISI